MFYKDKNYIASKIKFFRKNAKMTQEQLAELVQISPKQISKIETGTYTPSLPTFIKIINVLNINPEEFGINIKIDNNPKRQAFIELLYSMNDKELDFYFATINSTRKNLKILKWFF